MKRTEKQPGEEVNPTQLRSAVNDGIAFLHSMVKFVERRELREVDFDFANEVLAMAGRIIALGRGSWDARLDPGHGAYEFFEAFEHVPVPVFKGIMSLVERELRKDADRLIERISNAQETPSAERAA